MATKSQVAICGYIRMNYEQKCWIDEIIAIIIQFCHNIIEGGSLVVFGNGKRVRLGLKVHESASYRARICVTPTICPPFDRDNAFDVSAGMYGTFIVDVYGDLWRCGRFGKQAYFETPTKLDLNTTIISVCATPGHTLFLLQNGFVQSMGSNSYGQLGLDDLEERLVPKTIQHLTKYKIIQISAGGQHVRAHSAALTANGDLFCFGCNDFGQCGIGNDKGDCITTPTMIDMDDEIAFVDCGNEHTLLITRSSRTYSFGYGGKGRLGHQHKTDQWKPTLIELLKDVNMKQCAAGSEHSLCMNEDGFVYSFGSNRIGQCAFVPPMGVLKCKKRRTPYKIEWFVENNIRATYIAAGGETSGVISSDGHLYLFGEDKYRRDEREPRFHETSYVYNKKWEKYHYMSFLSTIPHKLELPQTMIASKVSFSPFHTAIICKKEL